MPGEKKPTQRDLTLIKILERLSEQLQNQDLQIETVTGNQAELTASINRAEGRSDARQDATEAALEKFKETILRYRSDMLSIVSDQDRIEELTRALAKRQELLAEAQEDINRQLADLDGRFKTQEKSVRDHYEFTVRQGSALSGEIADSKRTSFGLHAETEKNLGNGHNEIKQLLAESEKKSAKQHIDTDKLFSDEHKEIKKQISDLRQDVYKRLLALDGIEETLEILMVRTEPPEKKPFIAVRVFRAISRFFRFKVPAAFRKLSGKSGKKDRD